MTLREWALVAFTLLMQTSVGVLLVVSAIHPFVSRGAAQPVRALEASLLVATAVAALGLVASLAHLGQPLQAWLAVANMRTSWLSREIALALAFTGAAAAVALLFRAQSISAAARGGVSVVAIALGIASIYAMSRVYMAPAQPVWNRVTTPLGFFATAIVLGTLVVLVTANGAATGEASGDVALPFARTLVLVAIAVLAVQLVLLPVQVAALAREPAAAVSAASIGSAAVWLAAARGLLALAAASLLAATLRGAPGAVPAGVASAALVLAGLSEVLARLLFYASSVRI